MAPRYSGDENSGTVRYRIILCRQTYLILSADVIRVQEEGGMWKVIQSGKIPFTPYSKGIANIKRIVEKDKVGTERIAGFGLIEVPPGGVFGPHSHPEREEIYYVLSSSGSIVVEDKEVPAEEGLTLYVSGEDMHGMKNQGDQPLVVIFITVYK